MCEKFSHMYFPKHRVHFSAKSFGLENLPFLTKFQKFSTF